MVRYLMAHQVVIERVRKDYPVLPLKFGTLLRMVLEAVYVDMESASVVAIKPKPAFLPSSA